MIFTHILYEISINTSYWNIIFILKIYISYFQEEFSVYCPQSKSVDNLLLHCMIQVLQIQLVLHRKTEFGQCMRVRFRLASRMQQSLDLLSLMPWSASIEIHKIEWHAQTILSIDKHCTLSSSHKNELFVDFRWKQMVITNRQLGTRFQCTILLTLHW